MRFRTGIAGWFQTAFLVCVIGGAVAAPEPVMAQEAADAVLEIPDERLATFAAAFLAISAVRDETSNELGRVHDTQGKAAIRAKLEQKVGEILAQHELDAKQYQRLLFAVSADPLIRERFDAVIDSLKPKPTSG